MRSHEICHISSQIESSVFQSTALLIQSGWRAFVGDSHADRVRFSCIQCRQYNHILTIDLTCHKASDPQNICLAAIAESPATLRAWCINCGQGSASRRGCDQSHGVVLASQPRVSAEEPSRVKPRSHALYDSRKATLIYHAMRA